MGLTKPRASQIFDLDYKQATRVITVSNVTLTGSAPSVVDGVSLTVGDRVLVTGQSTGSENGLYAVSSVGVGSDGTWVRTSDGNDDGEIQAGMIVMVTEGTIYADTQWKLTTDGTIDIGVTNLTFVINILSDVGGANTQVQINDAGVLGGFSNFVFDKTTNVLSVTGNIDGTYILGNGSQLTGLPAGYADSDVATYLASGTVSTDIKTTAAISATGTVTAGNISTAGTITATGNITGGNIVTSGTVTMDRLSLTSTQTSVPPLQLTANSLNDGVGALRIDGSQADIFLNPTTATHTTVTFAVNNDQRLAFGMDNNSDFYITRRTGNVWYDDTFVIDRDTGELQYGYDLTVNGTITGNVTGDVTGNLTGNLTGEVTGNVSGSAATATSATTAGTVTSNAQPNITSVGTLTSVSVTGNVTGGNITTAGIGTFGTMTDGTVSFTAGNISGVDELRINQSGAGLRMTNVGAFDNDGSDNFRIFSTNDLILSTNGQSGTAVTFDATTKAATFVGNVNATGNVSGSYILGDGSQLTNLPGGGTLVVDARGSTVNVPITSGGGGVDQSTNWVETSATYDATAGSKLFVDTSSSAVQVNLPASPSMGDEVYVVDAAGNSGTYNITVNRNGNKITGLDEDFTIDVNGAAIILAYYNATRGWIVISK